VAESQSRDLGKDVPDPVRVFAARENLGSGRFVSVADFLRKDKPLQTEKLHHDPPFIRRGKRMSIPSKCSRWIGPNNPETSMQNAVLLDPGHEAAGNHDLPERD
jgi:hypothetical protein